MSNYPKAIFAANTHQLRMAMKAFGLTEPEWYPALVGSQIAGRRFSKIVVLMPHNMSNLEAESLDRWLLNMRCRVMPGDFDEIYVL